MLPPVDPPQQRSEEAIEEEIMRNIGENSENKIESESESKRENNEGKQNEDNEEENEKEPKEEKKLEDRGNSNEERKEVPRYNGADPMYEGVKTSKVYETREEAFHNIRTQEESKSKENQVNPINHGKDSMILMERNNPNPSSINEENERGKPKNKVEPIAEAVECEACSNKTTEELKEVDGLNVCDSCYTKLNGT